MRSRRPSSFVVVAALAISAWLGLGLEGRAEAAGPGPRVVYGGRLQDTQGRPIAGIYPLTFNLYKAEKGGKASWSETHFVAVDNGVYAVELGGKRPLPAGMKLDDAWLGIGLSGGKEFMRERFAGRDLPAAPPTEAAPAAPGAPAAPAPGAANNPPPTGGSSYAALAGFAYEAERAKTADAIGDVPAADVKALAKNGAAAGKVKLGANKRYSDPIGGQGGNPYTLQCPPGYIVTGIKGGAGGYVDSLTLICSPLE